MRIGIDIRDLSHNLVGGVHTYVQYLVPALLESAPNAQFFLYADDKNELDLNQLADNAIVRTLPYRNGLSSIRHDLITLKKWMAEDRIEIAHFPANYGFGPKNAKTIITLHDEINIMPWLEIIRGHPKNLKSFVMMSYLHACSTAAIREADLILTISEYSKQKISQYAPHFDPQRIATVYSAIDPELVPLRDDHQLQLVREKYHLVHPFILADALKNPAVIVRAWHQLPQKLQKSHQIVFFSRRPEVLPAVTDAVEKGFATLLIRPSWEDLIALFSQAKIFIFPSWIEGFGLPLLEAMTCGAPVIASDRGSIPEVAANAAIIIDAEDDHSLAQHLAKLLTNPDDMADLQKRGFARAAQFSWQHTAQEIISQYQALL